jgi:cytochrome c oxidase subunit 4
MTTHSSTYQRVKSLYATFFALMLLLAATMALSFVDLGAAHTSVGLGIAIVKTLLVMFVFMNLPRSSTTVRLASGASLIWLSFFVLCVMGDYLTRGWDETQQHSLQQGDHYKAFDRVRYEITEEADSPSSAEAKPGDQPP